MRNRVIRLSWRNNPVCLRVRQSPICPRVLQTRHECTLFGRVEGLHGGDLSQLSGAMRLSFLKQEVGPGF